jgi:hypothetical protein
MCQFWQATSNAIWQDCQNWQILKLQSNLSTTATLGTSKKWPLYRGGRSVEGFQSKLVSKLEWPDFVRPLLTGGRYSEVAVNTGLTVCCFTYKKNILWYKTI